MLPSAYACDEGSESLETRHPFPGFFHAVISNLLKTALFGYLSSSWLPPALFISLVCFTNLREKFFCCVLFLSWAQELAEASVQIYLSRCPPVRTSKGTVEFAFKIK